MNSSTGDSLSRRDNLRWRLDYLDGIRGLAAFYVVLFHIKQHSAHYNQISGLASYATTWMQFGRSAVTVFIVLSGYCLMLPVVRSRDKTLRGGAWAYLKRRAWRILPPYYAAFGLSLVAWQLMPDPATFPALWWHLYAAPGEIGPLLSHLFLVHNLSEAWIFKINGPLWSVATEFQIYLLFPVLLLPVWRRFGVGALLAVAFGLGLLPHFLGAKLDLAAPWFLGVFALGMVGAQISGDATQAARIPWRALAWAGVALYFGMMAFGIATRQHYPHWPFLWPVDVLVGLTTVCFLVDCTRSAQEAAPSRPPLALRIFGSRIAVALGAFSYSLYLTHAPVLGAFDIFLHSRGANGARLTLGMLLLAVPSCLAVAWAFHLAIERRFMPGQPRSIQESAQSAAISPAP